MNFKDENGRKEAEFSLIAECKLLSTSAEARAQIAEVSTINKRAENKKAEVVSVNFSIG